MNRISQRFSELTQTGRKGLVPYITAGDPDLTTTEQLMHALVENGADLIELGVPFSDPMADGPVIQKACERALESGTTLNGVLDVVRRFRKVDSTTPVILMGYLNPIEAMGYKDFVDAASSAGIDGLLTVDMPPEEAESLLKELKRVEIAPIFLAAPTTTTRRMQMICKVAEGFIYYVSLKGVTGARAQLDISAIEESVHRLKQYSDLPIGVGFGIRDADTAATIGKIADAVVIGSALVNLIAQYGLQPALLEQVASCIREIRRGLDETVESA